MSAQGYPVIVVGYPKVQLAVFPEYTPGNNGGVKLQAVKCAQVRFYFFLSRIGDAQRMYAVLQEIIEAKGIAYFNFRYIDAARKVIRR